MIWMPLSWCPYEANELGQIRRNVLGDNGLGGRVLKGAFNKATGYIQINLCFDGRQVSVGAHRLVCEAFHGPPPSRKHETAHANHIKTDNRWQNLRWVTSAENKHDMIRDNRRHWGSKFEMLSADEICRIFTMLRDGIPQSAIARTFEVTQSTISRWKTGAAKCATLPDAVP